MKKRLLALTLVLGLLASPAALAAEGEETRIQEISPWAYDTVADSYAMGLLDDFYSTYLLDPVTDEQLEHMTGIVADKLALLGLPARAAGESGTPVVIDTTRGGVLNALYQEAAAYAFSGVEEGPVPFLSGLGVVKGTGADLALERTCTYQEAMVMADRLILMEI